MIVGDGRADAVDVGVGHGREQRQRHGFAADALGVREIALLEAQLAVEREQVHAPGNARRCRCRARCIARDELAARSHALERQQHLEHVPVAVVEIARRQLAARGERSKRSK